MGKLIDRGYYTSPEEIPQPVGFITSANLRRPPGEGEPPAAGDPAEAPPAQGPDRKGKRSPRRRRPGAEGRG
jgi:hypothetical protein